MPAFICVTCGSQFTPAERPPTSCPVCEDPRQYVNSKGQEWTVLEELRQRHKNVVRQQENGLFGIGTEPAFAIGQRALLVQTPAGNILWDCISLIEDETIAAVQKLGGIAAIAISHPHYYSSMVEWSRAFRGAPIYLHGADRKWVMRPNEAIHFWDGEQMNLPGKVTVIRCGGHFAGGAVLHWPDAAEGRGALLSGDILQVCPDRKHVSFMYSYPNYIPLPAAKVEQIVRAVEPFAFDRIYGAWWHTVVPREAKAAVTTSSARYLRAISTGWP